MSDDTLTLLILCGIALTLAIVWYVTERTPRTPIPDVFRAAFEGNS